MRRYLLAIDQGTTGTTALLIDRSLSLLGKVTIDFPQHFPKPGWVEHNPEEIWSSVAKAVCRVLFDTNIRSSEIAAIGITNQRETVLPWDRNSGEPAANAIVWQCRRTRDLCQQMKQDGLEELFQKRTGLVLDPYFSGTKMRWLLDHVAGLRRRAEQGTIAFGTIDSFLVWRLSGGRAHVTDVSNASRTLLMDLKSLAWDDELLSQLKIPRETLPEIKPSAEIYAETRGLDFLPDGIPIAGMAGDQQAALFGQACFAAGEGKCTYGTGAFLLINTGDQPIPSHSGMLTTVAWQVQNQTCYALEGSSFIAGAAVQWLRDGLGLIKSSAEIEALAASVADSGEIVFIPALTGLGAPHWNAEARGSITGLTRGTTAAHLARATLEGVALQIHDLTKAMNNDRGGPLAEFKVDGGAAGNNLLMQMQADFLSLPVIRPKTIETTALGAAMLAGLAIGFWSNLDQLRAQWQEERRFVPQMGKDERARILDRWQQAIKKI
ncbi:MAG: glycerol kinase GlpK [Desulfuromonadales bacterium]|nr:glycerol kinase GlpK [Desulfuromonadales bacterium]